HGPQVMPVDLKSKRVVVTGGRGFLGSRVVAQLKQHGVQDVVALSSRDYDLTRQTEVARMYMDRKPEVVFHLAARVGGIGANRANPGKFFYANAAMGIEMMEQGRLNNVEKYVQVGTVCAYPKFAAIPFSEDDLWKGYPEETNAPYGLAKKMLLVQAQAYRQQYGFDAIYLLPVNLYGPGDNFDPASSHVIPALIRKCIEARDAGAPSITVWGTGNPTREFLYVDDAARGILMAAEKYDKPEPVNLGTSNELSIRELVDTIVRLVGFSGQITWDASYPDGQPRRKLDVEMARREFGFSAQVNLEEGLRRMLD